MYYVKDTILFSRLDELSDDSFEVLWISLRPVRLPRGITNLVVATVHHPPSANDTDMLNYLSNSLSLMESRYPCCGFILLEDFNQLNTTRLRTGYDLKQLVKFPTRGNNILDIVLTNLSTFFDQPTKRAPFGLSDHMSIEVNPIARSKIREDTVVVKVRDLRPRSRLAMRQYLEQVDMPGMLDGVKSCDEKTLLLETIVNTGMDYILPLRSKKSKANNPPWMNSTPSNLIRSRQKALNQGNIDEFKRLRNQVNRKRKSCRAKYYESSVQHLKQCKPSNWWKEVKRLSGMEVIDKNTDKIVKALRPNEKLSSTTKKALANEINNTFLSPMSTFEPLRLDHYHRPVSDNVCIVTPAEIFEKLIKLNPKKAYGPDGIPPWLLKENADLFSGPVTDILNCSYQECHLPPSWKKADVVAIPKEKLIQDINNHLRLISLTPILSKLGEEFVVNLFLKPAVLEKIDQTQFGTVPNSCTTHALISMLHTWFKNTDGNGSTTRVMLFDFRKAFDLIDHNILAKKLSTYNIPETIKYWILDFLSNRKQRVKLGNDCQSEWSNVHAGVPQGTKLGPWLFAIMVDDINVPGVDDFWRYVDDSTISESVAKNDSTLLQSHVNVFAENSKANGMELKETKCKELRISFSTLNKSFDPIIINNKNVEVVTVVKLLGVTLSNDLKWNSHIANTCKKVSTRLYFLRQLKRAGLPPEDLIQFYVTCIRPVIEYACEAFHDSLPQYLSNDLERLQKRAFRIIFPELHYQEVLESFNILSLHDRRVKLTTKLFNEIMNNPNHKLKSLLPSAQGKIEGPFLRKQRYFNIPVCKTNRLNDSFIIHNSNRYLK